MELMVAEIFLKAFVLCGILFLVARHEADFAFNKVVLVTCGITLGLFAMEAFLAPALAGYMPPVASAAVTILVGASFVAFMVVRFCWVRVWKGIIITILFMAFSIGLSVAGAMVMAKINKSVEEAGGSVIEKNNKEALQMFQEMMSVSSSQMMKQAAAEGMNPLPEPVAALPGPSAPPEAEPAELPAEEPVAAPSPERPRTELPEFARTPEWQAAQAKIKVSAVLLERDGSNVAIVNGDVLGIGDVLTVEVRRKLYRFKMAEITTDWVAWDPLEETDAE